MVWSVETTRLGLEGGKQSETKKPVWWKRAPGRSAPLILRTTEDHLATSDRGGERMTT